MLNSAEHEILNTYMYKCKNVKKFRFFFSGSDKPGMVFFLLINVQKEKRKERDGLRLSSAVPKI